MGSFAVSELLTTNPYVCGAAYIARMGDHCASCCFDPRADCPITALHCIRPAKRTAQSAGRIVLRA